MKIQKYKAKIKGTDTEVIGYITEIREQLSQGVYGNGIEYIISVEEDFNHFDCMGYQNYNDMPEIAYNEECNYYCVKNVPTLTLIENMTNEL